MIALDPPRTSYRGHPRERSRRSRALALAMAVVFAGHASAQTPADTANPGEVRLSSVETPSKDEAQPIDEIIVLGVRTGRLSGSPSASSSRIDPDSYVAEQKRLEDLLAETVGVQIRRFGGAGDGAEISIRGFTSSQVAVLLDGVKLNSATGYGVDFSRIPLSLLEGIEIVRGAGSLGAGSGAMGGVVKLRSRRPDVLKTLVSAEFGSFGSYGGAVFRSQPAEPEGHGWDIGVGYSGFKTDGDYDFQRTVFRHPDGTLTLPSTPSAIRINNRHEQHNLSLSVGRDLDDHGYLLVRETFNYTSQGEPGLERGVIDTIAGQHRFAHQRLVRSVTLVRWEEIALPLDESQLEMALSYRFERSSFRDRVPSLGFAAIEDHFDDSSLAYSFTPQWSGLGFGATHHLWADVGADWDSFRSTAQARENRIGLHLAVRDEISFLDDRLLLIPALRLDWADDSELHVLPSFGLVITPLPWLRIRGHIEKSFRNPSLLDLYLPDRDQISGNPDLEPERARTADLGIALVFDEIGWLREIEIEVSIFHSKIKNSILWLRTPYKIRPENSDRATSKGIELTTSLSLGPWIRLHANHTELRATADPGNTRLPGRANRETFVSLKLGESESWKLVGEFHHTGSITISRSGNIFLPARNVWNARAAINLSRAIAHMSSVSILQLEKLWLSMALNNIADVAVRDAKGYPQPGRSLHLGVEAQW